MLQLFRNLLLCDDGIEVKPICYKQCYYDTQLSTSDVHGAVGVRSSRLARDAASRKYAQSRETFVLLEIRLIKTFSKKWKEVNAM